MGIKERKRTSPHKREKAMYLIVCEGRNKTERTYLDNFKKRYSKIILHTESSEASDPEGMIKTAKKFINKNNLNLSYDKVFCLMDMDVNIEKSKLIDELEIKHPKIKIVRSNACFEVWFLLHFTANPKVESTSQKTKDALKKLYIPNYEENMDVFGKVEEIHNNIETASFRAKQLRKRHMRNDIPLTSVDANPYTEVDLLIDDIVSNNIKN